MNYLTLEVRQLAVTTIHIDESDLKKSGLTLLELEAACKDEKLLTKLFDQGKLKSLVPEVIEATELLNINITNKEFDDDMISLGGH